MHEKYVNTFPGKSYMHICFWRNNRYAIIHWMDQLVWMFCYLCHWQRTVRNSGLIIIFGFFRDCENFCSMRGIHERILFICKTKAESKVLKIHYRNFRFVFENVSIGVIATRINHMKQGLVSGYDFMWPNRSVKRMKAHLDISNKENAELKQSVHQEKLPLVQLRPKPQKKPLLK